MTKENSVLAARFTKVTSHSALPRIGSEFILVERIKRKSVHIEWEQEKLLAKVKLECIYSDPHYGENYPFDVWIDKLTSNGWALEEYL